MTKILAVTFFVFLLIACADAQSVSELSKQYRHHEVYELEPGVQMTPKFDSKGLICEMRVEQSHFTDDGVDLRDRIDEREAYRIIDKLVPVSTRGIKLNSSEECVGVCQLSLEYSNLVVKIISSGNSRLIKVEWRNHNCD